ncbi:MAG: hypothetical protein R2864_05360 [Syntrophotaleaceae bacterium]
MTQAKYIRWFQDIRLTDLPLVGGKNAPRRDARCPWRHGHLRAGWIANTAEGYRFFLRGDRSPDWQIETLLAGWERGQLDSLECRRRSYPPGRAMPSCLPF